MKHFVTVLPVAPAATAPMVPLAPAARAAVGEVAVLATGFVPLEVFDDPKGCHAPLTGAYVPTNRTDQSRAIHGDPLCLTPSMPAIQDRGAPAPPAGAAFRG
ncbi:hypothetical protein ACQPZF_21895 [Actinosynnema sp. CS-041913]|uniref:hypothetical protein n=1 Tax=Actinosynnema sp. CS-041913 TaxID=3239917 RepID=UPI003D8A65A6